MTIMQNKPHILSTGATGFVGRALTDELLVRGFSVVAGVRKHSAALPGEIFQHVVGDLLPETNWSAALIGVDVVIHAAARVHVMKETARDPLAEFRKANVAATGHLALMASEAGVRRFVFLSSVGVNGNVSVRDLEAITKKLVKEGLYVATEVDGNVQRYIPTTAESREEMVRLAMQKNGEGLGVTPTDFLLLYSNKPAEIRDFGYLQDIAASPNKSSYHHF